MLLLGVHGNVKSYWYNVDDLKLLYCPFPYSQDIGENTVAWDYGESHAPDLTFSGGINPVGEDRPCWIVRVWNKIFKRTKVIESIENRDIIITPTFVTANSSETEMGGIQELYIEGFDKVRVGHLIRYQNGINGLVSEIGKDYIKVKASKTQCLPKVKLGDLVHMLSAKWGEDSAKQYEKDNGIVNKFRK
jgi:hypothetical protein